MSKSTSGKAQTAAMAVAIARICNPAWRRFPVGIALHAQLLQNFWVYNGDTEQYFRRTRGRAAALFPVLQCSRRNAQKQRKGLLGQPHFACACAATGSLTLRDAGGFARFICWTDASRLRWNFSFSEGIFDPASNCARKEASGDGVLAILAVDLIPPMGPGTVHLLLRQMAHRLDVVAFGSMTKAP